MKSGLIFILGLAAGGIGGYLACKKKFEKLAEDAMAEYAEHYFQKEKELNELVEKMQPAIVSKETVIEAEKREINKPKTPAEETQLGYDDYEGIPYDPFETDYTIHSKEKKEKVVSKGCKPPFIISGDEYDDQMYDKVNLIYLAGDRMFLDLDTEDVRDASMSVGIDENIVGNPDFIDIGDCIYIRNEDEELDYRIVFDNRDYDTFKADAELLYDDISIS